MTANSECLYLLSSYPLSRFRETFSTTQETYFSWEEVELLLHCLPLSIVTTLTGVARCTGRHNEFTNNVVNGSSGVAFDNRGGGGSRCAAPGHMPYDFLFRVPFNTSVAWAKYPNLPTILSDEPCLAKYNNLSNNILCGGSKFVTGFRCSSMILKHCNAICVGGDRSIGITPEKAASYGSVAVNNTVVGTC